ncbi:MAG TPA: glycosyltransferase family 2 protein [Gemmataceae bacterium]|nr:glycosyltransferase family 2 protein [Gemmataceae bacterium]
MRSLPLIPIQELQPASGDANHWRATGWDPQFRIPQNLARGWVHIRVRLRSDVRGRMEWYTLDAADVASDVPLERADYYGSTERDFYVYLPESVPALRFDPLDVPGTVVIEELSIEPLSKGRLLRRALATKLRLLWRYRRLLPALRNGCRMLVRGDFRTMRAKFLGGLAKPLFQAGGPYDANEVYARWRQTRSGAHASSRALATATPAQGWPLLSLIVQVQAGSKKHLDRTLASVLRQTYGGWELILVAEPTEAQSLLGSWQREPRVRLATTNQTVALEQVAGDAFAFMDAGDTLPEDALHRVAEAWRSDPKLDMIYTDEDRVRADGRHVDPIFKPAWSPELLWSTPYTGRLCFSRTTLVRQWGIMKSDNPEAELALRLAEAGAHVGHIPDVLYHRADEHAAWPAPRPTRATVCGSPRVSILIPTAYRTTVINGQATTLLARCLESIHSRTTYAHYEIIVVDNGRQPAELVPLFERMGVRRFPYALPFNWAATMNQAAAQATGEYLVCLDDDTEVLGADWLERLLEYGQRPGVGAVGARLLFPDGRLQHAGVVLLNGHAIHPFAGLPGDHPGYLGNTLRPRNCSAVTSACMLTPTEVFRTVNGFREAFALYYNDIDYCLRVTERGWRVVYTPHATLRHYEAATKTTMEPLEMQVFRELWADRLADDPYYNPNLSADFRDYRIETDPERIARTGRGVRYGV